MAIDFSPSWMNAELALYRDTVIRFIDTEMAPHDEAARKQGHAGHALWRRLPDRA